MTVEGLRTGTFADTIRRQRLIVVLRPVSPEAALLALVDELADAGARVFEIKLDAHTAEVHLAAVRSRLGVRTDGPFLVGAGTVLRRNELEAARRAGADFAAATLLDASLVSTAVEEGLPFIPGAFTPTEVASAWAAGATFVKLFPASAVGPSFVTGLRGAMPDAQLIPTGGIDASSAAAYLDAGAAAVGIGTALTVGDAAARRAIFAAVATGVGGR
jgi:2-dehydro-3-deoxyphosphogluconate aldolase / (4S)-4-hydroxy-2-oxoglutarate aldolase